MPPTPDLPQLLHMEKLFGLSSSFAGGSFVPHRDFYYFRGYYFLVEDTTGVHCPLYAYEYHIIKGHDVPWPRFHKTYGRGSPFVSDYKGKKGKERRSREEGRADEEKVEKGKAGEERAEERRAGEGEGEKSALAQDGKEAAEDPRMQEQHAVIRRLDEIQANSTPVVVRSMASGIQASIDSHAVSSARSNAQVKYVPRDPRLEIMGKRVMMVNGKEIRYRVSMNREGGRKRDEEAQRGRERKERAGGEEERSGRGKERRKDLEFQQGQRGERERKKGKWRNEERERDEEKEKDPECHREQNKRKRENGEEEGDEGNEEESGHGNVQQKQRWKEREGRDEERGEERDDETGTEGEVQRKDKEQVKLTKRSKMARPGNCENCWVRFKDLDTVSIYRGH